VSIIFLLDRAAPSEPKTASAHRIGHAALPLPTSAMPAAGIAPRRRHDASLQKRRRGFLRDPSFGVVGRLGGFPAGTEGMLPPEGLAVLARSGRVCPRLVHRSRRLAKRLGKRPRATVRAHAQSGPDAMMTSQQLADELKRIATTQISDITRAVKEGQKSIALNEVRDMARRLGLLADAFDPKSAAEKAEIPDAGAQAA
jgi:hypothetical protein